MGNQDCILKGGELKTKIVYLIKGYPATVHLQYDGTLSMGPNFAKWAIMEIKIHHEPV